jgi:tripartite-type tricarboxylate transporter receptor subunit TctC
MVRGLAAFTVGVASMAAAQAQAWPERPITVVVPFPAGANTDAMGRLAARVIAKELNATVIVENRPGAGGNVGAEYVARARPDGYTLLMGGVATQITNKALYKELRYDPERDFVAIGHVSSVANAIVASPALNINSIESLVRYSKARKSGLNWGSGGNGTTPHLTGEMFRQASGASLVHIPYKGSAPALTDMLGGQLDLLVDNMPNVVKHAESGRMKVLAVTGEKRSPLLPSVPTLAELPGFKGFQAVSWLGVFAPAGTPADVVDRLAKALGKGMASAEAVQQVEATGGVPGRRMGKEFDRYVAQERGNWMRAAAESGAKLD